MKLSSMEVNQQKRAKEGCKNNKICPRKIRDDYSRFRIIAERRQMKPERNMQSRVAVTVTKVPLSGAE
jgi:hypothetical protein